MEKINRQYKYFFIDILILVTGLVWYAVLAEGNNKLKVAFLDVGQGDAIFIESPGGNQILIDGGPNGAVLSQLSKVMPFYDRSIDMVLMTHPDSDHVNGLVSVLRRYKVDAFVDAGAVSDNPAHKEVESIVADRSIKSLDLTKGYRINLDKGVYLDVLSPPISGENFKDNDGSLVARLVYGNVSFLLTGDMEKNMERFLLASGANIKSDVLKVGHHGSRTSTSLEFLGGVAPQHAVISVGQNNKYGHPHRETLSALNQFGISTLQTDQLGAIMFVSDGEGLLQKSF